jgi:hypothetical protein
MLMYIQDTCVAAFTTPGEVAGCPNVNVACICSNSAFISSTACCLAAKCDPADQVIAAANAQQICGDYGVTVPTAVSCLTSSSTTTSSATSTPSNTAITSTAATTTTTTTTTTATSISKTSSSASVASTGGALQNKAGVGVGFAGGLLAALVFLG